MIPWQPVEDAQAGIYEKILSRDPETGSYARLLKFNPGLRMKETLVHDFWEEVYILEGSLIDHAKGETFTKGMYACRPPGMIHGPYDIPFGCVTLETRCYVRGEK
ncbi:MAG: cupin domain-containing protein [Bacillota bacterium]